MGEGMNIIELAKQAGLKTYQEQAPGIDGVVGNWADLEAFAALVAAHERKACAKICETLWDTPINGMATEEECYGNECAAAIRARGTT
jgi:hypothetical protein